MPEFIVTFSQQYPREEHPLNNDDITLAHRDGWWTVVAADQAWARALVGTLAGTRWSGLYDRRSLREHWDEYYPAGELLRIVDTPHMDGRSVGQYVDRAKVGDQTLVTLYADGTGEVAHREDDADVWGPPTKVWRR